MKDSRKAFLEFCETVRRLEGDKDKFLDAAHLQRIEKTPTFTAAQLIILAVMLSVVLLCSVTIVCLAVTGHTGRIVAVLVASLVVLLLTSIFSLGI